MEFFKLVAAIACGYVLGQLLLEILGKLFEQAGRLLVKTVSSVLGIVAEQRRQASIAAAKAEAEENAKIVRE